MHRIALALIVALTVAPGAPAQTAAVAKYQEHYQAALQAYRAKDYATFLSHMQAAIRIEPSHPRLLYALASAQALTGQPEEALTLLERLASMGLVYRVAEDADFESLRRLPAYERLLAQFERNNAPVGSSVVAFTLPETDLLTEAVAFDRESHTFYVGSVHRRKILAVEQGSGAQEFVPEGGEGLWAVMGMKVDPKRRVLWVASSALPQMRGFVPNDEGKAGVFAFDLRTGALRRRYLPAEGSGLHVFGDLEVAPNGTIYVTDSRSPRIYWIKPGGTMELFVEGPFANLQGAALAPDRRHLFVADFSLGLFTVDLQSRAVERVPAPDNLTLRGTDGLYFHRGRLLAVQNGIRPQRVVEFTLDQGLTRVEGMRVLEQGNPHFDEPTLGVLVGDEFFYVANSQWESFKEDGTVVSGDTLRAPVVLRLML